MTLVSGCCLVHVQCKCSTRCILQQFSYDIAQLLAAQSQELIKQVLQQHTPAGWSAAQHNHACSSHTLHDATAHVYPELAHISHQQ
jgi:hypothetical protein